MELLFVFVYVLVFVFVCICGFELDVLGCREFRWNDQGLPFPYTDQGMAKGQPVRKPKFIIRFHAK